MSMLVEGFDWIERLAPLLVHAEHEVPHVVDKIREDLGMEPIVRPVGPAPALIGDPIALAAEAAARKAIAEFAASLRDAPPKPVSLDVGAETAPPSPGDSGPSPFAPPAGS